MVHLSAFGGLASGQQSLVGFFLVEDGRNNLAGDDQRRTAFMADQEERPVEIVYSTIPDLHLVSATLACQSRPITAQRQV